MDGISVIQRAPKLVLLFLWFVAVLGVFGIVCVWLEVRFNLISWDPKTGFYSVLPYFVLAALFAGTAFLAKSAESQGLLKVFIGISVLPIIFGILSFPKEKLEPDSSAKWKPQVDLGKGANLVSISRSLAKAVARETAKPNSGFLSRTKASPLWFRLQRLILLSVPFFLAVLSFWYLSSQSGGR